jgi:hypothetical protein
MTYLDDRLIGELGLEVDRVIETEDDFGVMPVGDDDDVDALERLLRTWS